MKMVGAAGPKYKVSDENKAEFITPLRKEEIPGTKLSRLLDDFIVYSARYKCIIISPKGMIADGESWFAKDSDEAGWTHDNAYRSDSVTWDLNGNQLPGLNRRQADDLFDEISELDDSKISFWKWLAVRALGHWSYHRMPVMADLETVIKVLGK